MNLWNANCDSRVPKPKRELLRELDIWENAQGGRAPIPAASNPSNSVMRKDFDGAAWSANHEGSFKSLIANARKKKGPNIPAPSPEHLSVSDDATQGPGPGTVEAEETPSDNANDNHGIQHDIVDLTSKNIEGVESKSDSGIETEGRRIVLEDNLGPI